MRFADTDLQGHVFFGNYYTYMDEAFTAYIRELGYSWQTLGEMDLELYYVDSGCQFKGRSFFEEDLKVQVMIPKLGNSSLTAEMTVIRENEGVVATGFLTAVVVNSRTKKSVPIPEECREAILKFQGG